MGTPDQLVPLADALGVHGFGKKAWGKLLEAKLIRPAQRIAGSKQHGLNHEQTTRLGTIATMRAQLGKRYALSAVAYAIANSGDSSVPIELVKDHLRSLVMRVQGRIRRECQRHFNLSSNPAHVTQHDVNVAAKKIARKLTKNQSKKGNTYEFLVVYAAMMLRMMYLGEGVEEYAGDLERLMTPFVRIHHPFKGVIGLPLTTIRDNATKLAAMISDIRGSLRLDHENTFFARLDDIPDDVFWKFFMLSPQLTEIIVRGYGDVATVIPIPQPAPLEWFQVMLLMTLIAHYDNANPTETYRELLAGSTATAERLIGQVAGTIKMAAQIQQLLRPLMKK